MSGVVTTSNRSYGGSVCLQCSGLRFVLGRHGQCYRMCQYRAPRYPAQPQLSCPSLVELQTITFILSQGETQRSGALRWVGPAPVRGLSCVLGSSLSLAELFIEESPTLSERVAPASALLWTPAPEEGRGHLSWSSAPGRGILLAWSAQMIPARAGALLTLL